MQRLNLIFSSALVSLILTSISHGQTLTQPYRGPAGPTLRAEQDCQRFLERRRGIATANAHPVFANTVSVIFNSRSRFSGSLMLSGPNAGCMPIYYTASGGSGRLPREEAWLYLEYDGNQTVTFPTTGMHITTTGPRQTVEQKIGEMSALGRRFDGVEITVTTSSPSFARDIFPHQR